MSASKALALSPTGGTLPRSFSLRRRRVHHRRQRDASVVVPGNTFSLVSIGLVAGVSLLLSLLACTFIVTGLAVWVANGAAEWLAAAVPALLAVLLFAFALRMARLLNPREER
jgi:hypothetical protein